VFTEQERDLAVNKVVFCRLATSRIKTLKLSHFIWKGLHVVGVACGVNLWKRNSPTKDRPLDDDDDDDDVAQIYVM